MVDRNDLVNNYKIIKNPRDYFKGKGHLILPVPDNIICFVRKNYGNDGLSNAVQSHHRYVCIFNLLDSLDVIIDGKLQRINKDEGLILLPYQYHKFPIPKKQNNIFAIFITFEMECDTYFESFRLNNFKLDQQVFNLLNQFFYIYNDNQKGVIPLVLAQLLLHIYQNTDLVSKETSIKLMRDNLLQKIITTINSDLHANVIEIANKLGYSESHLRRYFKKEMGMTLGRYIIELRISKSVFYLFKYNYSISEIAELCGYDSIYSFSRTFKKVVHYSPSVFRSVIKKNPDMLIDYGMK